MHIPMRYVLYMHTVSYRLHHRQSVARADLCCPLLPQAWPKQVRGKAANHSHGTAPHAVDGSELQTDLLSLLRQLCGESMTDCTCKSFCKIDTIFRCRYLTGRGGSFHKQFSVNIIVYSML
jgi:hypothetical protein